MGVIAFLILKATRNLHSDFDSYFICLLLTIETPLWCLVWVNVLRVWVYVKDLRNR